MGRVQTFGPLIVMAAGFSSCLAKKLVCEADRRLYRMVVMRVSPASCARLMNLGKATAASAPKMTITKTSSISVNPALIFFQN